MEKNMLNNEFSVLNSDELARIHALTLQVLREKGVLFYSTEAQEIFKKHGAQVDGSCVKFPPALVEQCIASAPSGFLWTARDAEKSIYVGEGQNKRQVMQDHGPVFIQERSGIRRSASLEDVINFYKLGQTSKVSTVVGQVSVDPAELTGDNKQLLITHELLKHTDKPVMSFPGITGKSNTQVFKMLEMVMGAGYLADHYCVGASACALSPLQYAGESADCIIEYAKAHQPIFLLTAPMMGVSVPMAPLAALVTQNAELLAGLVLAQLVRPGTPVIYGTGTATADMRTGAYVTSSPDAYLVDRASLQLAQKLYHLPTRTMAGNTDSKIPDIQAGYETMQNYILLLMGGSHLINECLGILDGMMTVSYEKYIIDEEILSRMDFMMQGLSTDASDFDISVIFDTPHGEPFLTHDTTLDACATQWKPAVACWSSYGDWVDAGSPSMLDKAAVLCQERLESAPSDLLGADLNKALSQFALKG